MWYRPGNPEELGTINLGFKARENFHEFQTKKKRKEVKVIVERAVKDAKAKGGLSEKDSEAIYTREQYHQMSREEQEKYKREKRERDKRRGLKSGDRDDCKKRRE